MATLYNTTNIQRFGLSQASATRFAVRKSGGGEQGGQSANSATAQDLAKGFLARLVTLIPSEGIAVYLAGKSLVAQSALIDLALWGVACWILVAGLRLWGYSGPGYWGNFAISMIAFPLWVLASGGTLPLIAIDEATVTLIAFLFVPAAALFYNDTPPPLTQTE